LVILSVTALGDLTSHPVLRSGARPGDLVAVAGPLGRSAAGLALLRAGLAAGQPAPALAALVAAHLRPAPPYDAGPEAARLGATAMIDVSDGLLADLGHVAAASGVAIDVDSSRLAVGGALLEAAASLAAAGPAAITEAGNPPPPVSPAALLAGSPEATALDWVLTGGEDHALVAAFPPGTALPARWRAIGAVRDGTGVTVDGAPHQGPAGWQHFR
jgi:thiamine-monophosphate kinase